MIKIGKWLEPEKKQHLEKLEPHVISGNETILSDKLYGILNSAVDILGGNAGLLALWREKEKRFIERVSCGLESSDIDQLRLLFPEAIPNLAESKQNFGRLSQLNPRVQATVQAKYDQIIAAPLEIDQKMVGLVFVLRPHMAESFGESDQRLLSSFALMMSTLIQITLLQHWSVRICR